jgi:uncharacterized membrane protein
MEEPAKRESKAAYTIKRIGGYLHKVVPIVDGTGKVLYHAVTPFMVELKPRDIMQIVVGSTILAIPVEFTEETWVLGETLPLRNALFLTLLSLSFIAAFVYFNFYRFHFREHSFKYVKRVLAIYLLSLLVVGLILTIIGKCPWDVNDTVAIKRIIIVAFPASMSAAVSDVLK